MKTDITLHDENTPTGIETYKMHSAICSDTRNATLKLTKKSEGEGVHRRCLSAIYLYIAGEGK